jgi:hypothetical protein
MHQQNIVYLKDDRPIDQTLTEATQKSIDASGVQGAHLKALLTIFNANQDECQVALGISSAIWSKHTKNDGVIGDVALALLVRHFLRHPEEWPVKYRGTPDLGVIIDSFKSLAVPANEGIVGIIVGRAQHTVYRWRRKLDSESAAPLHINTLLLWLEKIAKMAPPNLAKRQTKSDVFLVEYLDDVKAEAKLRDIDYTTASSWKSNN